MKFKNWVASNPSLLGASLREPSREVLGLSSFSDHLSEMGLDLDRSVFVIGVSGGPDSMCLLHLFHQLFRSKRNKLFAVTIDHGLRPDSAAEANQVARWCQELDVPHQILRWEEMPKPKTNIHKKAREARFQLFNQHILSLINQHKWLDLKPDQLFLCLAHHFDDQIETLYMRDQKGSGLLGMMGIQTFRSEALYTIFRPLLAFRKDEIKKFCKDRAIKFVKDPSNEADEFERARTRKLLAALSPQDYKNCSLKLLKSQKKAFTHYIQIYSHMIDFIDERCKIFEFGLLSCLFSDLVVHSDYVLTLFLKYCCQNFGGPYKNFKQAQFKQVIEKLKTAYSSAGAFKLTFGGAVFEKRGTNLIVYREVGAIHDSIALTPETRVILWDHRFRIEFSEEFLRKIQGQGLMLEKLGEISAKALQNWNDGAALPKTLQRPQIRASLPALWKKREDQGHELAKPDLLFAPFLNLSLDFLKDFGYDKSEFMTVRFVQKGDKVS